MCFIKTKFQRASFERSSVKDLPSMSWINDRVHYCYRSNSRYLNLCLAWWAERMRMKKGGTILNRLCLATLSLHIVLIRWNNVLLLLLKNHHFVCEHHLDCGAICGRNVSHNNSIFPQFYTLQMEWLKFDLHFTPIWVRRGSIADAQGTDWNRSPNVVSCNGRLLRSYSTAYERQALQKCLDTRDTSAVYGENVLWITATWLPQNGRSGRASFDLYR